MTLVDIGGGKQLEPQAAASYARARAAGMPAGGINSAYRDPDEQRRLFLERYQTTKVAYAPGRYDRRVYAGKAYWRKPGRAAVGVPGTSNHERGTALDVDTSSAAYAWLRAHGARYGWIADRVPNEPWHFEYDPHSDSQATVATPRRRRNMLHFSIPDTKAPRGVRYVILTGDGRRADYISSDTTFPNGITAQIGGAVPTDESLIASLQKQFRDSGPAAATINVAALASQVADAVGDEVAGDVADELADRLKG